MTGRAIPAANSIKLFFHCRACADDRPVTQSPSEWSSIEAGWTVLGLQVRCKRCDLNIVHIDFEGHKHPANVGAVGTTGGKQQRKEAQ